MAFVLSGGGSLRVPMLTCALAVLMPSPLTAAFVLEQLDANEDGNVDMQEFATALHASAATPAEDPKWEGQ